MTSNWDKFNAERDSNKAQSKSTAKQTEHGGGAHAQTTADYGGHGQALSSQEQATLDQRFGKGNYAVEQGSVSRSAGGKMSVALNTVSPDSKTGATRHGVDMRSGPTDRSPSVGISRIVPMDSEETEGTSLHRIK
jgi:hypothetical protein